MKSLILLAVPAVMALSLFSAPDLPWYLHRWFYFSLVLWLWCLWEALGHTYKSGLPIRTIPWPIPVFALWLIVNALWLGNDLGQAKVWNWTATCLPLLVWPLMGRLTPGDLRPLAWGFAALGLTALPPLVTLNPIWYGAGSYIIVPWYCGLSLLACLHLLRAPLSPWWRPFTLPFLWLCGTVAALGLLLSGGRGAVIAIGVSLLVLLAVERSRVALVSLGACGLVGLVLVLFPDLYQAQAAVLSNRFDGIAYGLGARILMAQLALDSVAASPLVGVGAGQMVEVPGMELIGDFGATYAHNAVLEIAAEFGVLAAILYVWLLWRAFAGFWRLHAWDRWTATLGLTSLTFLLLNAVKMGSMVDHRPLYLLMGIGLSLHMIGGRNRASGQIDRSPALILKANRDGIRG